MGIIGTVIGGVCSVARAACSIVKGLGGLTLQGLKLVVNALVGVAKALGLIKPETKTEDLGDKAIQAEEAGIKPENFDTYEEYVKAIEEFEVDPEKSKHISEEQKSMKAAEVSSGLILEKMPDISLPAVITLGNDFSDVMNADKMAAMLSTIGSNKELFNNMVGVLNNTEKNAEKTENGIIGLVNIEKTLNPELSDNEALNIVLDTVKRIQGS